jgi:hypothetical protein
MAYEDLLKDTSVADPSKDYFTLTITDLNPNTSYPIQLRWKYKDGTFSNWSAVRRLDAKTVSPKPSALPSTPTVKPVVGAIELAWNGKTSTGADQPFGFNSAKVYIGTTSNFTPTDSGTSKNLVDILNFANGQNVINIGVGTEVNSSLTLDYGVDYYVKIKTTNGNAAEDSTAVAATGNPVRIGQLSNSGLISISADKITTGTLQANASITVGAENGKRVILSSGSDPIKVYGSGGTADPLLGLDSSGNLLIKGVITATGGSFTGPVSINGTGGAMKIGTEAGQVNGTGDYLDGLYMGTNNYWYNDGIFKVGNANKNLTFENGNLSLVNTGTVTAGLFEENVTTTLNSNGLFSIISDGDSFFDWGSAAISVETQIKHTKLYPGQMTISLDTNTEASTIGSSFSIFHDGNGNVNFLLGDFNAYTPIRWINYDFYTTYDSDYIYGISPGNVGNATDATRSIVVTADGTQYVGHRNYYGSASSTTMSNATFGVDGDFYFSTNES